MIIPHAGMNPLHRCHGLGFGHKAAGGIIRVDEMPSPTIDMHLNAIPGDVEHTAPQISLAVTVAVVGEAFHRSQVVIMVPGFIRIVHPVFIKEVFVVVKRQRAVILGQAVLLPIPGEKGVILGPVPVVDGGLVQIGLDVGTQVEQMSFLGPNGEVGAAALENIRRGAGLHVGQHGFFQIIRVGRIEDSGIGVGGVELFQRLLGHRGEPVGPPILVDQLHLISTPGGRFGLGGDAGIQDNASGGHSRQVHELSPGERSCLDFSCLLLDTSFIISSRSLFWLWGIRQSFCYSYDYHLNDFCVWFVDNDPLRRFQSVADSLQGPVGTKSALEIAASFSEYGISDIMFKILIEVKWLVTRKGCEA